MHFEIGQIERPSSGSADAAFVDAVRTEFPEAQASAKADRDELRREIAASYGPVIDEMYFLRDNAAEAGAWASEAIDECLQDAEAGPAFREYHIVQRGLLAKALLSYGETIALVESGYGHGALSRVRTMFEVAVVAMVLAEHGHPESEYPDLPERFLLHREVFYRAFADDHLSFSGNDTKTEALFNVPVLRGLDDLRDRLISRFGKAFARGWGWAAPLFDGKPASLTGLVKLVTPRLAVLYSIMSSPVHAGSDGWHDLLDDDGEGSETFRAYPGNSGLDVPISLATGLLVLSSQTVVPTLIVDPPNEPDRTGTQYLATIIDSWHRVSELLALLPQGSPRQ